MFKASAVSINDLAAKIIVEEILRHKINRFFISPGSRSTPLTAAAVSCNGTECEIHFDERGAAFAALGYARMTRKAAVLICTSGTAAVNYYPAVVEASNDNIPLILLTADRPPELHDVGANQTIEQKELYGKFVRHCQNINPPDKNLSVESVLTKIDKAAEYSLNPFPGAVHINVMFREPLAPVGRTKDYSKLFVHAKLWLKSTRPFTKQSFRIKKDVKESEMIVNQINKAENHLIIAGHLTCDIDRNAVLKLSDKLNAPILPDIRSGLRFGSNHKNIINYYDLMLLSNKLPAEKLYVIHIGGNFVSKRLLNFIENKPLESYLHINNSSFGFNPHFKLSEHLVLKPSQAVKALLSELKQKKSCPQFKKWFDYNKEIEKYLNNYFNDASLSEPLTARMVVEQIKKDSVLFAGSSMPVRDLDMFADKNSPYIPIACNRGVSGIDGTVASFYGFASAKNKRGTLLIGDLALLHDLNSLSFLNKSKKPLTVVVINNNGGGIFSFLPINKCTDIFEKYFGTPHNYNFENAAELFQLDYYNPADRESFLIEYNEAQNSNKSSIIEIKTSRDENSAVHKRIYDDIKKLLP